MDPDGPGPPPAFERLGPARAGEADSPVVISVPHAGRDYPPALLAALAVPLAAAVALEDRHVDAVARAARAAETMLVARHPRAWIDLNRREDERDPAVDEGAPVPAPGGTPPSAKVRGGLGLVPRGARAALWRRRWRADEIAARIAADHRPYHHELAAALAAARARFGAAVLLDLHSMPPLPGAGAALLVIGDRHGRSAAPRFVRPLVEAAGRAGLRAVRNAPYAGGHIVERHGAPAAGVHAVQLEIARTLYLDPAEGLPCPGGVARAAAFLRDALAGLAAEAVAAGAPDLLAAE